MAALLSLAVLSAVFGVMCLVSGIRGLSQARAVVFNFRWITWVYITLVVLGIALSLPDTRRLVPIVSFRIWLLLAVVIVGLLLFVGWLRDGDYVVVGAGWENFQEAFHTALDGQQLSYEETPARTQLHAPEAVIRSVDLLDITGSIHLSIRPRRCQSHLEAVAAGMNAHFAAHPGEPMLRAFRLFTGAGGLGVVLALMLLAGVIIR